MSRKKKDTLSGDGTCTVAEMHGMTPEELIERRGVPTSLARNNTPCQLGMIDDGEEHNDGWANTNRGLLHMSLEIANLPDIDLMDAEAVRRRINEYFQIVATYGNKPTVAGLGLALNGLDRRRLWEIRTGHTQGRGKVDELPKTVRDSIKKAYRLMENLWENYMQNGKINPVAGIFLGKNNYGYQDKTEYVVTPNQRQENDYSEAEIRERLGLPQRSSNSESDYDSNSED